MKRNDETGGDVVEIFDPLAQQVEAIKIIEALSSREDHPEVLALRDEQLRNGTFGTEAGAQEMRELHSRIWADAA